MRQYAEGNAFPRYTQYCIQLQINAFAGKFLSLQSAKIRALCGYYFRWPLPVTVIPTEGRAATVAEESLFARASCLFFPFTPLSEAKLTFFESRFIGMPSYVLPAKGLPST
jgi:hypothetical protein